MLAKSKGERQVTKKTNKKREQKRKMVSFGFHYITQNRKLREQRAKWFDLENHKQICKKEGKRKKRV